MLAGVPKKKKRERRVSNLSIGMLNGAEDNDDDDEDDLRSSLFRSRDGGTSRKE